MTDSSTKSQFDATLLCPKKLGGKNKWAFVVLPREASEKLPRRGRTSIEGTINGKKFSALLEPDGKKSHWLKIEEKLLKRAGIGIGNVAQFEIQAVAKEPEPDVPLDFVQALQESLEAKTMWDQTTTIARIDWVHWVVSAKQEKTRKKRINDACQMLASGKKRVCCFDPSGFYSKALSAPEIANGI